MRRLVCVVAVLSTLAVSTVAASAQTPKFTNLFVFGDSYCDVGNVAIATSGTPKPRPDPNLGYFNGRFSNGPLWVDHIASYLGLKLAPALAGGTDYAFAGAWVTAPANGVPSVPQQVQMYLQATGGKADPDALYFLDGGGNDIVETTTGNPSVLGYQIAAGLADSEHMLRNAGARHFIIPNLFNVGLLPVASDHVAFAADASASANFWLKKLLRFDEALPRVQILRIDVDSLMNAVVKDQTHFGFVNVKDACLSETTGLCMDPDHNFFWDPYHPTTFGHAFFAVIIENALANPTD